MVTYLLQVGGTTYYWTNESEGERILEGLIRDGALGKKILDKVYSVEGNNPKNLRTPSGHLRPLGELRHLC